MKKLLPLHQGLIYPAFLGAALVDFAKPFVAAGWSGLATINIVWIFSGLWFALYFSVAYLIFFDTDENAFGVVSFIANFVEVTVILATSIAITSSEGGLKSGDINVIYISWIIIPITGSLSNYFSGRTVRFILSLAALLIGVAGHCFFATSIEAYNIFLTTMYLLLFAYLFTIFPKCSLNVLRADFRRKGSFGLERTACAVSGG